MSTLEAQEAAFFELLNQQQEYERTRRHEFFSPYPYQKKFYHAMGHGSGDLATERVLMAANQVGKTASAAMEVAYHLTGLYPEWWEGHRFNKPVNWLVGSNTNETTRDICQGELFGDPTDDRATGTGAVPKHTIVDQARKPGVPNAFDSVSVKHVSGGNSKVSFRAYEQGAKKHMGIRIDGGWMDEEPPQEIYEQYQRGTFATGGILMLTFTPEEGYTAIVYQVLNDIQPGQALVRATWDDAPHMNHKRRQEYLARIPKDKRDMRTRGVPTVGSGLIFPFKEEDIVIDPVPIQSYWRRICGVDFGIDHPFAAVWWAIDPDTGIAYLYDVWRKSGALVSTHVEAIKSRGDWIPVAWPHDGMIRDKQSGKPLADLYRNADVRMLPEKFSNPPSPGMPEGSGGNGVEVGLISMKEGMEQGNIKIFSTCRDWIEEQQTYHRKDGVVVAKHDDAISASRYGYQMRRFADTKPAPPARQNVPRGMRNW